MATKYEPLSKYLGEAPAGVDRVDLSFREIEGILGAALPASAYTHREWWSNQSATRNRPQARAWTGVGFMVDSVQQGRAGGRVCFRRKQAHRM